MVSDTTRHTGAHTIALERTAGRKPEQCRWTGYHAGQLTYYHVTISKYEGTKRH